MSSALLVYGLDVGSLTFFLLKDVLIRLTV
jgi:hypothetical protein